MKRFCFMFFVFLIGCSDGQPVACDKETIQAQRELIGRQIELINVLEKENADTKKILDIEVSLNKFLVGKMRESNICRDVDIEKVWEDFQFEPRFNYLLTKDTIYRDVNIEKNPLAKMLEFNNDAKEIIFERK